jgi:hypothetical protein
VKDANARLGYTNEPIRIVTNMEGQAEALVNLDEKLP